MDIHVLGGKAGNQPGGQLQSALTSGSNLLFYLVNNTFLTSMAAHVIPSQTKDAIFQLFCDLRANTPKDKKFLLRHLKAFKPETSSGWLALAAAIGYSTSTLLLLSTLTIGISVVGLSVGLMAAMSIGVFLLSTLGFLAFVLFFSACAAGTIAFTALSGWFLSLYVRNTISIEMLRQSHYHTSICSGYLVVSSSLAVMHKITGIVFGVQQTAARPAAQTSTTPIAALGRPLETMLWDPETPSNPPKANSTTSGAPAVQPHTWVSTDEVVAASPESQAGEPESIKTLPILLKPIEDEKKVSPGTPKHEFSNSGSTCGGSGLATPMLCANAADNCQDSVLSIDSGSSYRPENDGTSCPHSPAEVSSALSGEELGPKSTIRRRNRKKGQRIKRS